MYLYATREECSNSRERFLLQEPLSLSTQNVIRRQLQRLPRTEISAALDRAHEEGDKGQEVGGCLERQAELIAQEVGEQRETHQRRQQMRHEPMRAN